MARATAAGTTTGQGNPGWRYVGPNERGRELEIVAVELSGRGGEDLLLVIRAMPTSLRGSDSDA